MNGTYTLGQVCFGSLYQNVQLVLISVRGQPCRGLPTLRPLDISLVLQIYIHAIFHVNASISNQIISKIAYIFIIKILPPRGHLWTTDLRYFKHCRFPVVIYAYAVADGDWKNDPSSLKCFIIMSSSSSSSTKSLGGIDRRLSTCDNSGLSSTRFILQPLNNVRTYNQNG